MTQTIRLSVVIPAYNEERRLPRTLEQIHAYFAQQEGEYELLVVDDGSADATAELAEAMLRQFQCGKVLKNGRNRGKGYSVRQGVFAARGEFILFTDADLSTPIQEIEKLLPSLQAGYDIAIGSRGLRESDVQAHQPFYREYMGKCFNLFAKIFGLTRFADTQCGFKCFRAAAARDIFARQQIDHFSFDVEVLFLAAKRGYAVQEVPIQWFNEPHSRVNAIVDAARMFSDLVKIRIRFFMGKYD